MKKHWPTVTMLGCTLLAGSTASAGLTAQVTLAGSADTSVAIDPNITTTFSIDVNVSVSPETILSAEMRLSAGTGGIVEVVSGSYGPDWDPSWSLAIPVGAVDPSSVGKFGAVPLSLPNIAPRLTGNYLLATLDLQIVHNTPPGDYTFTVSDLVVGDADTFQNIGGQAGTPFTLTILPPAPAPTIASAVSRKTHLNGAGDFNLDLLSPLPSQPIAVECRSNGPTVVVVTFDEPVAGVDGLDNADVNLTSTGVNNGTIGSLAISGNQLTIQLSGTSNRARLKIGFPGIANAAGPYATVSDTVCFGVLSSDCNGDGTVNILDLVTTRNVLGASVTTSNFRTDVNLDGLINILDLVTIRNDLNTSIPATCP